MSVVAVQKSLVDLKNNKVFEFFVIGIIVLSALMVGAKTYDIPREVHVLTNYLDYFITVFFVFEISVRFLAEENKKHFFKDFWNVFDTLIVVISLIAIDNADTTLLARLVRVFRVLRMVSFIPELRILLTSLAKALPQLGYVMLLMFIIFYIYAAIGATLFDKINPELWGDISIALLTLFRVMTFEDWTDVMYETMAVYPLSWSYYLTFIFFTAFAFLNMVIGIVVNVMEQEHEKARKEEAIQNHEPTLKELKDEILILKAMIEEQRR